jgi:hypothetical protein
MLLTPVREPLHPALACAVAEPLSKVTLLNCGHFIADQQPQKLAEY